MPPSPPETGERVGVRGRHSEKVLSNYVILNRRRKTFLWAGLVLSLPAICYAGGSVVFYAWLSAAAPERWPRGIELAYGCSALWH